MPAKLVQLQYVVFCAKCKLCCFLFISDINECGSNPCQNEATCVDEISGYTCQCLPGWTGVHCEIGKYLQ